MTEYSIDVGSELTSPGSTGYIVFKNTSGWPVGYTKFSQTSGDRVAIPAVDSVNTGDIYITHIAWDPWWTGIGLVNTTAATKNLTIRFNTGETRTITLAAGQHSVIYGCKVCLAARPETDIESAVIENASGIVGLELFAVGMGGVIGGVPLISGTAATLYYPHVASDATWWTGLVAYNPSDTATQVTVNPYDAIGTALATSTQTVEPGGRYFGNSMQLNLPASTAWFSLESPNPMVGFELFGTFDGKRLAGFSAVDIEGDAGVFPKLEEERLDRHCLCQHGKPAGDGDPQGPQRCGHSAGNSDHNLDCLSANGWESTRDESVSRDQPEPEQRHLCELYRRSERGRLSVEQFHRRHQAGRPAGPLTQRAEGRRQGLGFL